MTKKKYKRGHKRVNAESQIPLSWVETRYLNDAIVQSGRTVYNSYKFNHLITLKQYRAILKMFAALMFYSIVVKAKGIALPQRLGAFKMIKSKRVNPFKKFLDYAHYVKTKEKIYKEVDCPDWAENYTRFKWFVDPSYNVLPLARLFKFRLTKANKKRKNKILFDNPEITNNYA